MKRALIGPILMLVLVVLMAVVANSSPPQSDEETLKNLEIELNKHGGYSDEDIKVQTSVMASSWRVVDPLGRLYVVNPADLEKNAIATRKANPDPKATGEIHDVKVYFSRDTAIVTYTGTFNSSGFKEAAANVSNGHFIGVDTWQKQSGKWKVLAGAVVSTEPIPAEAYKATSPGAPGANQN